MIEALFFIFLASSCSGSPYLLQNPKHFFIANDISAFESSKNLDFFFRYSSDSNSPLSDIILYNKLENTVSHIKKDVTCLPYKNPKVICLSYQAERQVTVIFKLNLETNEEETVYDLPSAYTFAKMDFDKLIIGSGLSSDRSGKFDHLYALNVEARRIDCEISNMDKISEHYGSIKYFEGTFLFSKEECKEKCSIQTYSCTTSKFNPFDVTSSMAGAESFNSKMFIFSNGRRKINILLIKSSETEKVSTSSYQILNTGELHRNSLPIYQSAFQINSTHILLIKQNLQALQFKYSFEFDQLIQASPIINLPYSSKYLLSTGKNEESSLLGIPMQTEATSNFKLNLSDMSLEIFSSKRLLRFANGSQLLFTDGFTIITEGVPYYHSIVNFSPLNTADVEPDTVYALSLSVSKNVFWVFNLLNNNITAVQIRIEEFIAIEKIVAASKYGDDFIIAALAYLNTDRLQSKLVFFTPSSIIHSEEISDQDDIQVYFDLSQDKILLTNSKYESPSVIYLAGKAKSNLTTPNTYHKIVKLTNQLALGMHLEQSSFDLSIAILDIFGSGIIQNCFIKYSSLKSLESEHVTFSTSSQEIVNFLMISNENGDSSQFIRWNESECIVQNFLNSNLTSRDSLSTCSYNDFKLSVCTEYELVPEKINIHAYSQDMNDYNLNVFLLKAVIGIVSVCGLMVLGLKIAKFRRKSQQNQPKEFEELDDL